MYYDAKADAELVSVPTFAVEDGEQPEPHLVLLGHNSLSCKVGVRDPCSPF
jgi:hypothetical protein